MVKVTPVGDHAGNYSSSAESRKSGYGSAKKSAPAAPARKSTGRAASVPLPTKRPAPNTASRSPAPAANPSVDKQYSTYSTSGATQSAQKRAKPSTFNDRPNKPASNGRRDTIFNSNSAMPGEKAMNDFGKKAFNKLNTMKMPGEDAMNKLGSKIKKRIFG